MDVSNCQQVTSSLGLLNSWMRQVLAESQLWHASAAIWARAGPLRCRSVSVVLCCPLLQLPHIMNRAPAHLCGRTCRWQMASGETHGESSPLAELTLKLSGRLGSRSEPVLPCRESESWTSSLHGLRKFNYSLMKSELTSLRHHHPAASPPPPSLILLAQLKLIIYRSRAG